MKLEINGNLSIVLVALIVSVTWIATTCGAEELPELDPAKKTYQSAWGFGKPILWPGGGMREVRERTPKTVSELKDALKRRDMEHRQQMKEREQELGGWMKLGGWALVALGAAAHFCSSVPALKSASSSIIVLGFATVLAAVGMQKTAQYDWVFDVGLAVLGAAAVGFVLYRARNWSLSHSRGGRWALDKLHTATKPKENTNE